MLLYKTKIRVAGIIVFSTFIFSPFIFPDNQENKVQYISEVDTIENFDDGEVILLSYADQDLNPTMWSLSNTLTYNNSPYSLRLYGNTWKLEPIEHRLIDSGEVWQVSAFIQSIAEIQGFGITDSVNTLFYSFAGIEELDPQIWITVYQGAFPLNTWNNYKLPVADDWLAKFGYFPVIKGIVFVNDKDNISTGTVYFDEIIDITSILPAAPQVSIEYSSGKIYKNAEGLKSVDVQFTSIVYDPDSWSHTYFWNFGDDSTSSAQNPAHTFLVEDDHDYTVFLKVTDSTGMIGTASCRITVDAGASTFPVTINFVGDIILARRIENHINLFGYQSLIDPTFPFLGNAADITIANLESPLTTSTAAHPTKPILLKGSPFNGIVLKYAGIDLVTLANNHILDYGLQGITQTKSVVISNNIIPFGAGADSYEALQPAFFSKSGVNFAFLGSSDRTGQYNNYQPYLDAGFNKPGFANLTMFNIVKQINSVKHSSDIIILQMHSGSEYSTAPSNDSNEPEGYSPLYRNPSEGSREIRQFAIDSGADAVICHHPHIIHGFEVYKNKLIAHSLGNFIFDLDYPETYPSVILNGKVNETGIYNYSVTPVYIDDYIPKKAEGELGLYILDDLAKRSKDLDTYLITDKENISAEIILDTTFIQSVLNNTEQYLILQQINSEFISPPVPLKRNGSISSVDYIQPGGSWKYRLGRQLIWFGNFEDEGCSLWEIDNADEYYDTSQVYRGLRSFCQKRIAGQIPLNTNLEERILMYGENLSYTLHSRMNKNNSSAAGVTVQFYETRTSSYMIGSADINADSNSINNWTDYYKEFNLPVNAKYINLRLRSEAPSSGTGYVRWDDTGLIEWTEWQDYSPMSSINHPNDYYWVQLKNSSQIENASLYYSETSFTDANPTSGEGKYIPAEFKLEQNYPNPFNASTTIRYELPSAGDVKLKIYNILGEEIKSLVNDQQQSGRYSVRWNGSDNRGNFVSSGIYFYRLETNKFSVVKKLLLLK